MATSKSRLVRQFSYSAATLKEEEALEFLGAVDEIMQWAAGRL